MEKLLSYINALPIEQQRSFAAECGTSIGYLRKAISKGQQIGEDLCIRIEMASGRLVTVEDMRPDLNHLIAYLRGSEKKAA